MRSVKLNNNILTAIEENMKYNSRRVAAIYKEEKYTYADLDKHTYRIAAGLQKEDLHEESLVVVYMKRSWLSVCATIGILRAGFAFLPIDKKIPIERIKKMLALSKARIILTDSEEICIVSNEIKIINVKNLVKDTKNIKVKKTQFVESKLAYVIFTSGSTGEPKGVMIEHGGMFNHIKEKIRILNLNENSIVAHNASIGFDISIWQIFAPICCGGKIVIFSDEAILLIKKFIRILEETKTTILEVVPTYLSILIKEYEHNKKKSSLKYIISTGEELSIPLAQKWFKLFPNIPLVNAYGPTEASDDIAHCIIKKEDHYTKIPIGIPIKNAEFLIRPIDNEDEKGELWVYGICVGRGYIGNREETQKYFTTDSNTGKRIYKTGDIVSKINGNFYYWGRIDNQIKYNGNRVELEEIRYYILQIPHIDEAIVFFDKQAGKICAVYHSEHKIEERDFQLYLKKKIPSYMIPTMFFFVEKMPINIHGKIDIGKLKAVIKACK